MKQATPHPTSRPSIRSLAGAIALVLSVAACGSGSETTAETTSTAAASDSTAAPSTTAAPAVDDGEAGDPADPATDAGAAYCDALDRFFVAQNAVITDNLVLDDATWTRTITELDAATPLAAAAAPDNHAPILAGFGDVVSRMAELSAEEFDAHPTINDEASEYFFGDLFVITSHATEVCGLDISFDVELDIEPNAPVDVDWTATCEAIDDEYLRLTWTNETGAAVAVEGDVLFTAADGSEIEDSFDLQVVPVGERVSARSFAFEGTAESCEVVRLDAFPLADSFFYQPAEAGDRCTVEVDADGNVIASVEALALADGDIHTQVGFYDADGVMVAQSQFFAFGEAVEGEVITLTDKDSFLFDDGMERCEVLGRFEF